jgi:hypothetical protein
MWGWSLLLAIVGTTTVAQACPVADDQELWLQAACDFAAPEADVKEHVERVDKNLSMLPLEQRNLVKSIAAAPAVQIDMKQPRTWAELPVPFLSIGHVMGLYPNTDLTDAEADAMNDLMRQMLDGEGPKLVEVLNVLSLIAHNRGLEIVVIGDGNLLMFAVATNKRAFCKWKDVKTDEFRVLVQLAR